MFQDLAYRLEASEIGQKLSLIDRFVVIGNNTLSLRHLGKGVAI